MNDSGYFITNGWHQGSIIDDKSAVLALLKKSCGYRLTNSPLPEFLVIISQDCDILHHRIDDEPFIDFIAGCFNKKDGNLFHGKNPRKLQIECGKKTIGFIIHDILRVKKIVFEKINPKHSFLALDKKDIKLIISWISKRYSRAAFPDEFMKRLSKSKQIDKAKRNPLVDKVSLIFVDIPDVELKIDQDYSVTIIAGVQHGSDQETRSQVEDLFYASFNIPGIKAEIEVHDEYDITYEIISTYMRFDWDFRSLAGNSGVAAPAPGIVAV